MTGPRPGPAADPPPAAPQPVLAVPAALPTDATARSRGVIALLEENCTACMLCVRDCPDWCIVIEAHQETTLPPGGGRPRQRNMLDRFAIDFSLCMYCGICIDVCPFDALFWAPAYDYPAADRAGLTHERTELRDWLAQVPPPPALDPAGEEGKEVGAARGATPRT